MTVRAYIGIGSNLDNPVAQVLEAVEELEMIPDTILVARSSLYSGRPMGPEEQPDYVNAVVSLDTLLSAEELHRALVSIEDLQGRSPRWREMGAADYRPGFIALRQQHHRHGDADRAASGNARA